MAGRRQLTFEILFEISSLQTENYYLFYNIVIFYYSCKIVI